MMKQRTRMAILSLALILAIPLSSVGQTTSRTRTAVPFHNALRSGSSVTYVTNANELVQALVGPQVQVANATLVSSSLSAGTFTGGSGIFGIDAGVVLSTGDIATIQGPNLNDETSTDNGMAGDADLDALIPGFTTYDATILEFDFMCQTLNSFTFQYVFGSEEYNEYVDEGFNDVFAFFLDGNSPGDNIATVPAFCSSPGIPVAINNVNGGNPYTGAGPNSDCFINNDLDDGGGSIDTELDGMTHVFIATGNVSPGVWHHLKIAIADAGDNELDSDVLIKGESLDCGGQLELGACCDGSTCHQMTIEECVASNYQPGWIGVGIPCDPSPCEAEPDCDAGGPYSGDAGVPVQFDASGSYDPNGSIVAYGWDFGDGTTGTGVAPTHTYAADGVYNVVLCVTDNSGNTVCCSPGGPVVPAKTTNWGALKALFR